jgi:hypothetical protein
MIINGEPGSVNSDAPRGMLKMPGPQLIHDVTQAGNRDSGGAHARQAK